MKEILLSHLKQIERQENVNILYACDVGSRAWGYASNISDYDLRFIYVHPIDRYLSIDEKADTLERPIKDGVDISGWELRKTLKLFRKSNPSVLEWLHSPIVYRRNELFFSGIKELEPYIFSEKACLYHYLNMAKKNYRNWKQIEAPTIKLYLHILRPLLMAHRIQMEKQMPLLSITDLLEKGEAPQIRREVHSLITWQREGKTLIKTDELYQRLHPFVEQSIRDLEGYLKVLPSHSKRDVTIDLDALFRDMVSIKA